MTPSLKGSVKFGRIDNHSQMRGHMGQPEASQGDLENQPVLSGIEKILGECTTSVSIDRLVQNSGGTYNLCEPSQTL
jgi:hypothetical protein